MAESICSCCKLLGKPPGQVNFIITTGVPHSLVYHRIEYLLSNYSDTSSYTNDTRLTNYETLISLSDRIFTINKHLSDQSTSTSTHTCCNGFNAMPIDIDDISNLSQLDTFRKTILELLDSSNKEKPKVSSWIMLHGSICLESAFLSIFIELSNSKSSSLLSFTFTTLCFLVNEERLFQNWLFQSLSIQDYQSRTYPEYDQRLKSFFSLLNSSKYLQENTLLVEEQIVSTDSTLQTLLQGIFRNESSKYRANNDKLRFNMAKLLLPSRRTVRDIRDIRQNLQGDYHRIVANLLKPIFNDLQNPATAANATRQIVRIVLDDFRRMNGEELRVYKRQMTLGFNSHGTNHANTIAAQLVHYALHLLRNNNDDTLTPLIYAIILTICILGSHFFFRHELFNHTPEIYTLSLLLVNQRQYPLALAGLRLCKTILNGDQNEHKYAITYLTHDPLTARKILDTIKWILSPFQTLKILWREEDEEEKKPDDPTSTEEESTLHITERCCFRHAVILVERSFIRSLASLFYGSADHCIQVTVDDVVSFVEVMNALVDPRIAVRVHGKNKLRSSLLLVSEICALLTPILLHGKPLVSLALQNENTLLLTIPRAIQGLLKTSNIDEDIINTCIRFYTQLVQSKCEQDKLEDNSEDSEEMQTHTTKTIEQSDDAFAPLNLSKNLISSYFDLHKKVQKICSFDEKSAQQEHIQTLFNDEWKKLEILELQHDFKQLKHEQTLLNEELLKLRNELQRTQLERDQFRKENTRMSQEIDNLKQVPMTNRTIELKQISTATAVDSKNQNNTIDELENLAPHEVTSEQAEKFIRKIYHRRTTFNDNDMRKSICGSLKHLGSDLYSSPVHFLHELIQNAEDNFYDVTIMPCLRIELNHTYILLSNNEKGLRAKDVLAICSLAVTTKTSEKQEHIGEKGVGFKSVFAASNQPMLISHAWQFHFQVPGTDAMSYITPLWITNQDIPKCISNHITTAAQHTHLYLPLKLQAYTPETKMFLDQVIKAVDPCILLNMRQLKKLEIVDQRDNKVTTIEKQIIGSTKLAEQANVTFEDFTFLNLTGSIIRLHTTVGYNTFRVYTCYINVPNSIEQRGSPRTRLIIAFPCEHNFNLTNTVYAGLPVCDLGFNFLFNADFQLVTNRENVRENVRFNTFIRDHLAALFVYLLLNDTDLRQDSNRFCPTSNTHLGKNSSWWHVMIDNIDELITRYLSTLFDIEKGKKIRYLNKDLASFVSNEQLDNCANIYVVDPDNSFFTLERLKSFQIQSVTIIDILNCFPRRDETPVNEFRQQFRLWTQKQDEQWWCQLFYHLTQIKPSEIANNILEISIFLLENDHQRQYLTNKNLLLFISDHPQLRMWKRQLTLLHYSSKSERTALLASSHVQLLTEERMIEIIRQHHIELTVSSAVNTSDIKLIEEIWEDLFYLKVHVEKLDKSIPFLVPVLGTSSLTSIQNAVLPSLFGIDIRSFMHPTSSSIIMFPYHNTSHYHLFDILQWEYFLLEMGCQRASIYLPVAQSITELPLLPLLAMFSDEKYARLGELILSYQNQNTKDCLSQFPMIDNSKVEQQISRVSATFDEILVHDLPSLPRITIPSYSHVLAKNLGICVEYDLRTCVTILQLLSNEKNTNIDLYIKWLSRLQLYVNQQHTESNSNAILLSCQLYFPDQQNFYALNNVLIISNHEEHHNGIAIVSRYLKLQLISPLINQIYWQFKDLFHHLGCLSTSTININHICTAIYLASRDKDNFFPLGNCATTLTENGMEMMITLYQYLEDLILKCVQKNSSDTDLYRTIVTNKHPIAAYGSREDLEWRFSFTCNSLSERLKNLTGIQSQRKKVGLLTINRRIITKKFNTIIYACLETKIIHNFSKDVDKRYFILPLIVRTCPLVVASFGIDYIERRSKILWKHENHNLEFTLRQLGDIFRRTLNDPNIEVITAKYANVTLFLSDSCIIDTIDENNKNEINNYSVDSDYPFWIFNETIFLCTGYLKDDASKAIIAISALTTLLHKRKHVPFEEAKSIAQQKISTCTAFRSEHLSNVASTDSTTYSYIDLLFPTDHQSIESVIISIGKYCTIEQDLEKVAMTTIATNRVADDEMYRNRVKTLNHFHQNVKTTTIWKDSLIVDGIERIRIGQYAEHFFFVYLQNLYGSINVTPINNWRSSSRLAIYPQYRRHVDDSAGYDFELHDTQQLFAPGSGSTSKHCYFEVKGTSGSFSENHTRFNISQNELNVCQSIVNDRNNRDNKAYFIVIIENCLDAEKISFGTVINWSQNLRQLQVIPDSYQCRVISSSSTNSNDFRSEDARGYNNRQQQEPTRLYDNRSNYSTTQSAPINNNNSASNAYALSNRYDQQQQRTTYRGRGGDNSTYNRQNYNRK
ncbi:unnamed protein product [Rotaria magnacalcarata]|uniref:Uncharacterized protein n=2 Tax=Rotaria magnacalcarata TaxID=392030 RepID=A0A816U1J7_9BILA|nr:unnamed protein product [Rotaria magnacalcarata]CAF3762254.1 unnamed protein product [Rotaria magnacalcarata]